MSDPLFYWRQNHVPWVPDSEELTQLRSDLRKALTVKTCTKCGNEISSTEKFIKITINGDVTYRHDRKCA